jgi:hypothetical protein
MSDPIEKHPATHQPDILSAPKDAELQRLTLYILSCRSMSRRLFDNLHVLKLVNGKQECVLLNHLALHSTFSPTLSVDARQRNERNARMRT